MTRKRWGSLIAILLVWPLTSWAQIARPDPLRASVRGTVVFAAGNRPASGVAVELWQATGGQIATVLTDWNGDFRFEGVACEFCSVVVREPGYLGIQEGVVPGVSAWGLQLYLTKTSQDGPRPGSHLVTVRELTIPPKARKAFEEGLKRMAKRDPAGCLLHFELAIAEFPNYYEAYCELGLAYVALGRNEEAEQAFQKSIELSNGRYAAAHRALGLQLCREARCAVAEPILRKAVDLEPTFAGGYYLLARALFGLNRPDEAEKNAREALLRKPDLALAQLLLANIYIRRGDRGALLQALDAYLKLEPNGTHSSRARQMREEVVHRLSKSENAMAASAVKP